MFKTQNFCHIASNNRNQVKVGVFVYRTTDDLATVTASGYFNERIIDINLHDLIIHEKVDNADATKVQRNLLCVTERTLENVGTALIKSKWEGDIEQDIADIEQEIAGLDNRFVKLNGTSVMTGPLKFRAGSFEGAIAGGLGDGISIYKMKTDGSIDSEVASLTKTNGFVPGTNNAMDIGRNNLKWKDAYVARVITSVLNNGYDIAVPVTNSADTLALKSEVDLAANSGRMITAQGVWYAKMYAGTTAPSAIDGTNYADFSQTDGQGNPIIVIYERTSGTWVQSETITPPAEYDGYVPITSKIWDIAEQAGQQGGRVLWNHQSKEFTPYPQIVSFDNIEVTGESTVIMPLNPTNQQIVNKEYVDNATADSGYHPDLFDHKWADHILNDVQWLRADTFSWQDGGVYEAAYNHLADDISGKSLSSETVAGITVQFYLADDGHKICPDSQASNVESIFAATGVAWYYIIDTVNERFKLPRTKHGFTGLRDTVNNYVAPGLPNVKFRLSGIATHHGSTQATGMATAEYLSGLSYTGGGDAAFYIDKYAFDVKASNDSSIYGNGATVQPPATQQYLYFYVGSFTQTALENTAGLNASLFNNKADLDLANVLANIDYVVESQLPTAGNNYIWYRKYRSGWVEQGGNTTGNASITLPVTMADLNYNLLITPIIDGTNVSIHAVKSSTSQINIGASSNVPQSWMVCGMAA